MPRDLTSGFFILPIIKPPDKVYNMTECFFSNQYAHRADLFEGLSIWKEERFRELQGTWPVIFLSLAKIKATNYEDMEYAISSILFHACQKMILMS